MSEVQRHNDLVISAIRTSDMRMSADSFYPSEISDLFRSEGYFGCLYEFNFLGDV